MNATRREWLWRSGGGLGGVALAALLQRQGLLAQDPVRPPRTPRARRVVQMFMAGGASHLDLFDFKPELIARAGQPADFGEPVEAFQDGLGPWLPPVWPFRRHGQCGRLLADVVAELAAMVDDIAFVHDMVGRSGVHSQATLLQTTGFLRPGFPGMGAWIGYGLGSLDDDLPTFVVLPDHRGLPSNGSKNWDSAFLSARHQGTVIRPGAREPIAHLHAGKAGDFLTTGNEAAAAALQARLDREHAAARPGDERLLARIRSYELAARMQVVAPDVLDLGDEPDHVMAHYGIDRVPPQWPAEISAAEESDHFARRCLFARRLLERDVRFVQIWSGNDNGFPRRNWDSHEDVARDHGPLARGMARGAAAFLTDLKRRGLLDDTIVLWTTEFGRLPSSQGGKGRDHNPFVFTNWLCGGGIRGGIAHGSSDAFGYKPLDRGRYTTAHDLHATILHLLGIDHERLTFRHDGIDRRLTDVHGRLIPELLA